MKVFTKEIHKICPYLTEVGTNNKIDIASDYCIQCHHRVNYDYDIGTIKCDYEDIHRTKEEETKTSISGIWNNEYVRTLGILDHCQEVIKIYDEIRIQKINSNISFNAIPLQVFNEQFNKELMDLYLILDKHFENNNELKEIRLNRFKEKEK